MHCYCYCYRRGYLLFQVDLSKGLTGNVPQRMDSAVHYSAVQCSALQCSAVQCITVQCSAVQCSAVHHMSVQCSAVDELTLMWGAGALGRAAGTKPGFMEKIRVGFIRGLRPAIWNRA